MTTVRLQPIYKRLPKKASTLIRLAIRDSRKVKKTKTLKLDAAPWHSSEFCSFDNHKTCSVCFAGAVMHFGLEAPKHASYTTTRNGRRMLTSRSEASPVWYDEWNAVRLVALDRFRVGCVHQGLTEMQVKFDHKRVPATVPVTYIQDVDDFLLDMESMAAMLEVHGL